METFILALDRAGLSQRQLAARLDRAHSSVGKIESGERQSNALDFCEYADALNADAADLLRQISKVRR